jgi:hypothetical protein
VLINEATAGCANARQRAKMSRDFQPAGQGSLADGLSRAVAARARLDAGETQRSVARSYKCQPEYDFPARALTGPKTMSQLFRISLTKAHLDKIPHDERVFYLMAGQLSNDLNILSKLVWFAFNQHMATDGVVKEAALSQTLLLTKLLAGKLYEGHSAALAISSRRRSDRGRIRLRPARRSRRDPARAEGGHETARSCLARDGDALALTFAHPVLAPRHSRRRSLYHFDYDPYALSPAELEDHGANRWDEFVQRRR